MPKKNNMFMGGGGRVVITAVWAWSVIDFEVPIYYQLKELM